MGPCSEATFLVWPGWIKPHTHTNSCSDRQQGREEPALPWAHARPARAKLSSKGINTAVLLARCEYTANSGSSDFSTAPVHRACVGHFTHTEAYSTAMHSAGPGVGSMPLPPTLVNRAYHKHKKPSGTGLNFVSSTTLSIKIYISHTNLPLVYCHVPFCKKGS